MRVQPKTDAQIQEERKKFLPFPPGEYQFEVMDAADETSKAGNPMLHLKLKVFHPTEDETRIVDDYLTESMSFKIKNFAYAIGRGQDYEAGELCPDEMIGCSGRAKVAIRVSKDPKYQDKNEIKDYLKKGAAKTPARTPPAAPAADPGVPF